MTAGWHRPLRDISPSIRACRPVCSQVDTCIGRRPYRKNTRHHTEGNTNAMMKASAHYCNLLATAVTSHSTPIISHPINCFKIKQVSKVTWQKAASSTCHPSWMRMDSSGVDAWKQQVPSFPLHRFNGRFTSESELTSPLIVFLRLFRKRINFCTFAKSSATFTGRITLWHPTNSLKALKWNKQAIFRAAHMREKTILLQLFCY